MNNKLNNMLQKFMEENNVKNIDEANEKLQEFILKYNAGAIEYENTPLDDANELLEKAENAKSKKQAIKYAKEAYEMCPDCFDAILFQVNLEDDPIKKMKMLDEGLEHEKTRLEKEKYFQKDNIGHFYGIFETRPYIRGLYTKAHFYAFEGKMKQARDICKEILRLNENDNTGARYLLMAIYACLEEEDDMLKLHKKYQEDSLEMLLPLYILYFKRDNQKKAQMYLDKVNKANPNFVKFFKGTMKANPNVTPGYYSRGDSSEVMMYLEQYDFLFASVPTISEYVIKNSKK